MQISTILILILAIVLLALNFLRPHGPEVDRSPFNRPDNIIRSLRKILDLREDQKLEIERILLEIKKNREERMSDYDYEKRHARLISMIKKDSLSSKEILSFIEFDHINRNRIDEFLAEKLSEVHSLLYREQKEILVQKLNEFEEKFKDKRFKPQ